MASIYDALELNRLQQDVQQHGYAHIGWPGCCAVATHDFDSSVMTTQEISRIFV